MSKDLRFYKDPDNRWYVELPEYPGVKAELEMVAGADTMLEMIAEGNDAVMAHFDLNPYEGGDELVCQEVHPEGGATYILKIKHILTWEDIFQLNYLIIFQLL